MWGFIPFFLLFFWLQTLWHTMILHRTLLMYIMKHATMQIASSTAVKKLHAWVHQRNFYVLPPVFYHVIEVLPNSGILRVFRGHVNHERMSFIFLYTLGLKHKKHEIILQKQISKDHYSPFIHLFTISILYSTLLLTATVIICFLYPSHC